MQGVREPCVVALRDAQARLGSSGVGPLARFIPILTLSRDQTARAAASQSVLPEGRPSPSSAFDLCAMIMTARFRSLAHTSQWDMNILTRDRSFSFPKYAADNGR